MSFQKSCVYWVLCWVCVVAIPLFSQTEEFPRLSPSERVDLIHRAESYLINRQSLNGTWDGGPYPTAISALAGLALVSTGNLPGRGSYGDNVERAIYYLLNGQDGQGVFGGNGERSMYGHGYATLFLSQVYGMTRVDQKIRGALEKAVKVIANSQSVNGGWYYTPFSRDDEGSVTIVQVQALRATHNAGIDVPYATIQKSMEYIRNSQEPDGSIAYGVNRRGSGTLPLTAQGMAVLFNAGQYDTNEIQTRGFSFLDTNFEGLFSSGYFYYTHFYAAQTFKQRGGKYAERYLSRIEAHIKNTLVKEPSGDIYWNDNQVGPIFATSMAILILAMPLEYLPIFTN